MKKSHPRKKLRRSVRRASATPVQALAAPVLKLKQKPRGKPFQPGNKYGLASRFKAGQPSANPAGRPSLKKLAEACADRLAQIVPKHELAAAKLPLNLYGMTYAQLGAWTLAQEGMRGNVSALEALGDRAEGKPATTASPHGSGEDPLTLLLIEMRQMSKEAGPPEGFIPQVSLPEAEGETEEPS